MALSSRVEQILFLLFHFFKYVKIKYLTRLTQALENYCVHNISRSVPF